MGSENLINNLKQLYIGVKIKLMKRGIIIGREVGPDL
jgi:hypothetical protein